MSLNEVRRKWALGRRDLFADAFGAKNRRVSCGCPCRGRGAEGKDEVMKRLFMLGWIGLMAASGWASEVSASEVSWNGRIIDVKSREQITIDGLSRRLKNVKYLVLGEKHNTPTIQHAQAQVMEAAVKENQAIGNFTLAWEFLNFSSQPQISSQFDRFLAGEIDVFALLMSLQGSSSFDSYVPLIEGARALKGRLLGVNLSRAEKAPVVQGGIAAADPSLVPPGFEMGSDYYRERFEETMAGHAPAEKLSNYFAAQCLTDDVMAYRMFTETDVALRVLVTGSFHADYHDGVVARLLARDSAPALAAVRFIDASDYTEATLIGELLTHPRYGDLADFVFFVNEPQAEAPAPPALR